MSPRPKRLSLPGLERVAGDKRATNMYAIAACVGTRTNSRQHVRIKGVTDMGLRAWIGLCEHKWKPTGHLIETSAVTPKGGKHVTGYIDVRECERCGAIKGFRL